jgi:hypothetical protein
MMWSPSMMGFQPNRSWMFRSSWRIWSYVSRSVVPTVYPSFSCSVPILRRGAAR